MHEETALDIEEIGLDTPLFSAGVIDSFSLVSLMSFIEQHGDIRISPGDVTLENFDSIERIMQYVNSVRV